MHAVCLLAIDPGYDRCGIAVLEKNATGISLVYSNCIRTSRGAEFVLRLRMVEEAVEAAIKKYSPTSLAIERLHLKANRQSAMHVAEARGVILAQAGKHGLGVHEYAPATVKVAVTGYGKADKAQVTAMVKRQIHCPDRVMLDDEYDAIAVGLAHFFSIRPTG